MICLYICSCLELLKGVFLVSFEKIILLKILISEGQSLLYDKMCEWWVPRITRAVVSLPYTLSVRSLQRLGDSPLF